MFWLFGNKKEKKAGDTVQLVCPYCRAITHCTPVIEKSSYDVWFVPVYSNSKVSEWVCQQCGQTFTEPGELPGNYVPDEGVVSKEVHDIAKYAESLVNLANEAANKSNDATKKEVKEKYLKEAWDALDELKNIAKTHSFIKLQTLQEFEYSLKGIEKEIAELD